MPKNISHYSTFRMWEVNEKVKRFIEDETCFGDFINLLENIEVPRDILHYLLDLYENNSEKDGGKYFLFDENKKIYCNLEDVFMIMKLPIDGKEVTGLSSRSLSLKYLGEDLCEGNSRSINLVKLREHFKEVDVDDEENFQRYVRAYLLYLFGCILFPDLTGSRVPTYFLSCMDDITMLDSFAWGAAFFAHLMVSLDNYYANKKSFKGSSFFLVIFFCERIPSLMSALLRGMDIKLPMSVPLLIGWVDKILKPLNNKRGNVKTDLIVQNDHTIIWQLYKRLQRKTRYLIDDQTFKTMFSKTICICFDKAAPHTPHLAWQQYGDKRISKKNIHTCLGRIKLKSPAGAPRDEDWSETYSKYIKFWKERHTHYIKEFDEYKSFGEDDEEDEDTPAAPTSSQNHEEEEEEEDEDTPAAPTRSQNHEEEEEEEDEGPDQRYASENNQQTMRRVTRSTTSRPFQLPNLDPAQPARTIRTRSMAKQ